MSDTTAAPVGQQRRVWRYRAGDKVRHGGETLVVVKTRLVDRGVQQLLCVRTRDGYFGWTCNVFVTPNTK